jgi:hypothetical protein
MCNSVLFNVFFFFFNLGTVVRNKWKSLRDKFRTTLASIPKSKSGDVHVNNYRGEWKYTDRQKKWDTKKNNIILKS